MSLQVAPVDPSPLTGEAFRAMEAEWDEISARRAKALLDDWRRAMSAMCRQQDRLVSEGFSTVWPGSRSVP